jgi:hypothetical protein
MNEAEAAACRLSQFSGQIPGFQARIVDIAQPADQECYWGTP